MVPMNRLGCLTLVVALCAALALPILFPSVTAASLGKLGIPGDLAVMILLGMLIGSAINVPLWRLSSPRIVRTDPFAVIGLGGILPRFEEHAKRVVIAVNVGGCLIPLVVVAYQIILLAGGGGSSGAESTAVPGDAPDREGVLIALVLSVALNALVCSKVARPVSGVGIALP
ncbi:MAG: DUF1614 domain-containing protein, partial [Planctomycetes bacterium]|nr:DUF1614 domain-containing protein [Planctomycetota bacterium]